MYAIEDSFLRFRSSTSFSVFLERNLGLHLSDDPIHLVDLLLDECRALSVRLPKNSLKSEFANPTLINVVDVSIAVS